ncbi:MAG: RNA polymerase subunit sigma-24 [Clostridiaceae bacterium]|nr:RNA polymerase subunit sigma-24 [Clostridiaceae bacterium]
MTREELGKLRSIQKEVELIKKELNTITEEYVTDKVTGSMVEHPYILTHFKISGYDSEGYSSKVKRLERKLKRKLDELMDERARIEEYIESIDNATVRIILRLRYINGLGWNQIGNELGYSERQCRRKYKEFFEKDVRQCPF